MVLKIEIIYFAEKTFFRILSWADPEGEHGNRTKFVVKRSYKGIQFEFDVGWSFLWQ